MPNVGDDCGRCRTKNALVLKKDTNGDYWSCWSCGDITEDPNLRQRLPSDGAKFAPSGSRV